jgi:transcriptional regulator with XRE-family HTH domain
MNHQQFATAVGVSRGAVQQWEKGDTAPKRSHQKRVADLLGVSVAELMDQSQPDQKPIRNTPTLGSAVVVLPHLNKDEAGMFERYLNGELEPQKSPEVWAMPSFFEGVPVFALTIEDDVMEPLIPKGSQVIIGVGVPHQSGDKVFIREGSSWLIRRLLVDGDLLYIDSPRTPSRPLTGELVGPVVSVNMPTMNLEERMKNK